MNELAPLTPVVDLMIAAAQPDHGLGPVIDDWHAAEVWLRSVARKSRSDSDETVSTYRFHLAKLRWFCEQVRRVTPSRWTLQDVEAFKEFLADVPADALCARVGRRYANETEPGQARAPTLLDAALADSVVVGWEAKNYCRYWRPVHGIREASPGPTGRGDRNPHTLAALNWTPLGAPASNLVGPDFTPPFPAYPSGHAVTGGVTFQTLRRLYGDGVPFTCLSDEWKRHAR